MKTFSIRQAFKKGWKIFKANKKVLVLSTLIIFLVSIIQEVLEKHYHSDHAPVLLAGIILFAITVILQIGWYKILLKLTDGMHATVYEIASHSELFFRFIITQILLGIGVGVGLILLVVPGVYFILTYMFAPLLALDTERSIGDCFEESARITEGAKWKLLALLGAMVIANILGAIALGVGLLVSVPVSLLAYFHVYRTLEKASSEVVRDVI